MSNTTDTTQPNDWVNQIDADTWIISDTHFHHDRIMIYEPSRLEAMQQRGYESMDQWMLDNWNQRVGEQDLVLHLGDFAFKEPERYLNQLNGRILLLLGNHDIPALNSLVDYAQRRPDKLYVLQQCEGLVAPKGVSGLVKTLGDKKLMFTHYPLISDDPYIRGSARKSRNAMAELFMQMDCEWSIHGHVHSKDSQLDQNEVNVSMERTEFAPIKLGELIASRIG